MKKAGVVGFPIEHSLSPAIHEFWLKEHGIEGSYERFEVVPERLEHFLKEEIFALGLTGVNVTIPHKEVALKLVKPANRHPLAEQIGAANTLVVKNGQLFADNTDFFGFMENWISQAPKDFTIQHGTAIILGAGGAARAVIPAIFSLYEGLKKLVIVNRSEEKSAILKQMLVAQGVPEAAIQLSSWENIPLSTCDILVNTTSLGMNGQPALDIDLSKLSAHAIVGDIVYNPLETSLLLQAKAQGNPIVEGLGMLLYQAAPAFEAFFGQMPDVTPTLRQLISSEL